MRRTVLAALVVLEILVIVNISPVVAVLTLGAFCVVAGASVLWRVAAR